MCLCLREMLMIPPGFFPLPKAGGRRICPLALEQKSWCPPGEGVRREEGPGQQGRVAGGGGGGDLAACLPAEGLCCWVERGRTGWRPHPARKGLTPGGGRGLWLGCFWIAGLRGPQALLRLCPKFLAFLRLPGPLPARHPSPYLGASARGWCSAIL